MTVIGSAGYSNDEPNSATASSTKPRPSTGDYLRTFEHVDRRSIWQSRGANATTLPALPTIRQIARTVPGEAPDAATALVGTIAAELLDHR